jgi:hypothetical protein
MFERLKTILRLFQDNWAVIVYHADLLQRAPRALSAMLRLEGRIDKQSVIAMNSAVKMDRRAEGEVAAQFLAANFGLVDAQPAEGLASRLARRTIEHLRLTILSLGRNSVFYPHFRNRAWSHAHAEAEADRATDCVACDSGRHEDGCGDQCRHRDVGRLDWRGWLWPAHFHRRAVG